MKIKHIPCAWNPHAAHNFPEWTEPDTEIEVIDSNIIKIDDQLYEFPPNGVACPNIREQTDDVIHDAHRDDTGVLCLTVRRFYTESCAEWDDGQYHDVEVQPTYGKRGPNVQQIKMLTQDDIDAIEAKKRKDERLAEIQKEIDDIEYRQARPIRAIMLGTATKEDHAKLAELDKRADNLRKERDKLSK